MPETSYAPKPETSEQRQEFPAVTETTESQIAKQQASRIGRLKDKIGVASTFKLLRKHGKPQELAAAESVVDRALQEEGVDSLSANDISALETAVDLYSGTLTPELAEQLTPKEQEEYRNVAKFYRSIKPTMQKMAVVALTTPVNAGRYIKHHPHQAAGAAAGTLVALVGAAAAPGHEPLFGRLAAITGGVIAGYGEGDTVKKRVKGALAGATGGVVLSELVGNAAEQLGGHSNSLVGMAQANADDLFLTPAMVGVTKGVEMARGMIKQHNEEPKQNSSNNKLVVDPAY